jgi:hypothetical protein
MHFFEILVKYYNKFINDDKCNLEMPESIKNNTNEFMDGNDPVKSFLNECCEITGNRKDFISSIALYEKFMEFNTTDKVVTLSKFKTILLGNNIIYKTCKNERGYIGIKLKCEKEMKKMS